MLCFFFTFFGLCAAAPVAHADKNLTFEAFAASEPVYRGVSEAQGQATVGASLEWSLGQEFFLATTAQASELPAVQQRERQVLFLAGWQKSLNRKLTAGVSLSHRVFPGSTKDWDSTEVHAAVGWDGLGTLELSYSPDYYTHDTRAVSAAVRTSVPLGSRYFFSAEAGAVEMSSERWPDYQYATLGLGWRHQNFVVELRSSYATNEGSVLFGEPLSAPRLLLQASHLIR